MNQHFKTALAALLGLAVATTTNAQQNPGTGGTQGGSSTQGGTGTQGGTNTQRQGGTTTQGGTGTTQGNLSAQSSGTINQQPWFSSPEVQRQLNLNQESMGKLQSAYKQAHSNYMQQYNQLGNNLNDPQRQQRLTELNRNFNTEFNNSVGNAISDPNQRQRFNQLYYQYQGYGAFNDPTVQQKLNLTQEQRQRFNQYNTEWNNQMNTWRQSNDQQGTSTNFNNGLRQMRERINQTLTPEQQRTWQQMTGDPYQWQWSNYHSTSQSGQSGQNRDR